MHMHNMCMYIVHKISTQDRTHVYSTDLKKKRQSASGAQPERAGSLELRAGGRIESWFSNPELQAEVRSLCVERALRY